MLHNPESISWRHCCLPVLAALTLAGCAQTSAIQMAGTVLGAVLEATGAVKRDNDPNKNVKEVKIQLLAGEQLNLTASGKPLSLVTKIYVLRSNTKLKMLNHDEISSPEREKETFGTDLISVREVVLIPGKAQETLLRVPGDATSIGVVGLFRQPYANRWKLGFDPRNAHRDGIIIGAHACAFNASQGALDPEITPESARSLLGIQCKT